MISRASTKVVENLSTSVVAELAVAAVALSAPGWQFCSGWFLGLLAES